MTVSLLPDDPHDRALVGNVHPPGWANPTPAPRYNLVVVGAGTAGLVCAAGAAGLGARVALVERELMGGDCLNVGCVPSKALLRSARAAAAVRDAGAFGARAPAWTGVDFPQVMERLRRLRAGLSPTDSAGRFRGLGVDVFLGQGRFAGPDAVEVGGQTLRFSRAVIATGGRAAHPAVPGLAEAGYLTNESVFALTALPRRLAVLGAGPIGCELAQAFARLGSKVTLLEIASRILPREDADAAELVGRALARDGVEVVAGCEVLATARRGEDRVLKLRSDGSEREAVVDEVLVGAGRQPNVEGLGLESAGVAFDPRKGVTVDDRLRTTNRRIFAAGDVCSRYQFTHAADAMARIVLRNAFFLGRGRVSALTIPWCTYTDPEVARVGLSEAEAREKGVAVRVFTQPLEHVDRAVLDGEAEGFAKVLVPPKGDRILGATIVSAHAGEMIGEVSLAVTSGLGLRRLADTIHPYPTQAEALRKLGDAYNRTRLTPWVRWLFGKWLAWRR
jgi:pyruvate/2-oxoglutarate dehydrogenase complex dihydrolipoamide dehydrogenase (E3) component